MKALHVYILVGGIAIASSCSTAKQISQFFKSRKTR
jgi:hypothetical protein